MSRILSGISKVLLLIILCLPFSRCATAPSPVPPPEPLPQKRERLEIEPTPGPRSVASLQMTEQARLLIQENRPEEAIRILERAVNLHPANGVNYYYLAEAWLMKGNVRQAGEFNGLAAVYLRDHAEWRSRLRAQQERIAGGSRQ